MINKDIKDNKEKLADKWTDEQKEAISIIDHNMIVSASAGSGKTSVMIERVYHILDKIDIDRILMLTFSNASALDMKNKLQSELIKACSNETDFEKRKKLIKIIDDLNISQISTIHSFCKNLLKKYFNEAGIDPCFDILENSSEYIEKALTNAIEKNLNGKDEDFILLYNALFEYRSDKKLRDNILKIFNFLNVQRDNEQFINEISTKFYNEDLYKNEIAKIIINNYKNKINYYREDLDEVIMLNNNDLIGLNTINDFEEIFKAFNTINDLKGFKTYFDNLEISKEKVSKNDTSILPIKIKELRDNINKIISDFRELTDNLDDYIDHTLKVKPYIISLIKVVQDFKNEYTRLKNENKLLDFSDLENFTCKILKNDNIRKEIKESYDFVFIDEYQDTNYIQDYIISNISEDNIFMVGDPKQSIYQFRLCEPKIFIKKYEQYSIDNIINHKVDFFYNFRSSKDILDVINTVFSSIMTKEKGGIDYISNSMLKTKIDYKTDENYKAVNITILQYEKEKTEKQFLKGIYSVKNDNELYDDEDIALNSEAIYISDKIIDMINNCKIYCKNDSDEMVWRQLKYADFAILTSVVNNDKIFKILNKIKEKGIPVNLSGFKADTNTPDIALLINYLKLLDNYNQDIPLISVMKSPYGGFSNEELAKIKLDCNTKDNPFFYEIVKERSFTIDSLGNKIKDFYTRLEKDRIYSDTATVYDLCMHFTEKVNYNAYLASLQNSEERIKTLNNFINSLYGKNYGNKIVDFINYYENYSEDDELFNNDSDNNGNSINVFTIHKSKGLEFPVVFLIDINHKFNKFDITSNNIFCDNELGISMPYYDEENKIMYPNLISEAMSIKKKQELIEERMRLFYVALTRARNHLFVIGVNEGNFGNKIKDNIQCFMDWLNNISYSNLDFKKTIEIIKINNDLKEKAEEKGEKVLYAHRPADKKAVEEIKKVLDYKYSYLSSTTLPVKFTVTELNEQEDKKQLYTISNDEDENTEDIKIENKTEYDYIERGIIYHKIMQNIDLSLNTYDEVLISVKEMVDNQIISSEEYQKIDIFDVLKCLNSSIIKYASGKKILREKSFIYNIEANKIIDTNAEDKVLLQGTVDMIILDEKIILIDYKASRKTKDEIIKTYKKQMDLYALVIEGVYKRKVDKKIIYVFNQDLEIEM